MHNQLTNQWRSRKHSWHNLGRGIRCHFEVISPEPEIPWVELRGKDFKALTNYYSAVILTFGRGDSQEGSERGPWECLGCVTSLKVEGSHKSGLACPFSMAYLACLALASQRDSRETFLFLPGRRWPVNSSYHIGPNTQEITCSQPVYPSLDCLLKITLMASSPSRLVGGGADK